MPVTPDGSSSLPGLNLPSISTPNINLPGLSGINLGSTQSAYQGILGLLGNNQPQSLTNTLGPLLSQIFGTQGNLLQPFFQQQGAQGAAQAQSNAMQRGLTGSSIEASNIQQAYNQSNQNFSSYLAQQLSGLGSSMTGLVSSDIGNQQNWLNNLAQLIGQGSSSTIQQSQFAQQLAEALQAAQAQADATQSAGMWEGIGSAVGGAASHYSDIRLKTDIHRVGQVGPLGLYVYRYNRSWLPSGFRLGFMAQEVEKHFPEAVGEADGYKTVNMPLAWGLASA